MRSSSSTLQPRSLCLGLFFDPLSQFFIFNLLLDLELFCSYSLLLCFTTEARPPALYSGLGPTKAGEKPRVLVLGTGWAGCRLMKGLDTKLYDVVCVSPRNHMVFTPLLDPHVWGLWSLGRWQSQLGGSNLPFRGSQGRISFCPIVLGSIRISIWYNRCGLY
ncbi:putative oxidoreductase [Rosa chinensis]|uniref:Putative oxidoreductase n=1 Tax=Rosa chinensis TaxID=74649 RepID=A0A2P6SFU1_ROSCH|nr:putative oxidoreductase [Rosa chinensis]